MLQGIIMHIKIMDYVFTVVDMQIIVTMGDAVHNAEEIGKAHVVAVSIGI